MRKFWEVGGDVRKSRKVESLKFSEGKESKKEKHRPNLENSHVVVRN